MADRASTRLGATVLKRMATWLALLAALDAGFLVGKATDTVLSGDGRLASDRSDVVDLGAPATTAVPTTPTTEPPTTVAPADTTPPELMIVNPAEGEQVEERAYRFEGFTEPGASVTVGSAAADVGPDGEWSILLKLKPGINSVTVVATDPAGNQSSASVTLRFDPSAPPPKEDKPACAQTTGDPCKPACSTSESGCKPACAQTTGDPCKPACSTSESGCEPACAQNEGAKDDGCEPACAQNEEACDTPSTSTPVEIPVEAPVVE